MVGSVGVEIPVVGVEPVIAPQIDHLRPTGRKFVADLPRQTMWQGEEGDVDVTDVVEVVRTERAPAAAEMRMYLGQQASLFAVGAEMDEIELGVVVDESNDLSPGIAGSSDDCD
jgi:hypothetical protein